MSIFFSKNKKSNSSSRFIPFGVRVYAIGDIHGRFDLLENIHKQILEDSKSFKGEHKLIIYCGDYIDRGLQSKQVLDCLSNNPMNGFDKIYLKGNHEHAMMMFMSSSLNSDSWLHWGGEQTLESYGIATFENGKKVDSAKLSKQISEKLPEKHRLFLNKLKVYYELGDYIFVHAGIKPNVELSLQKEEDMLMIRDDFILSKTKFNKTIVFGHTIFDRPLVKNDRIGIDTGAYKSDKLTCLILEGSNFSFLETL